VIEAGKDLYTKIRGKWRSDYFKNEKPITVELACGRGEYTIGLAELFPDRNFIGVDIKGDRIWKGSSWAIEKNLKNVAFLRTQILNIESFFTPGEVDEIWLTFPDPRPRKRDAKRRLTSSRFLEMFSNLLSAGAWFRFKTDNTALFEFSLQEIQRRTDVVNLRVTSDLYASDLADECHNIKTRYEEMFSAKGEKIKYLRFVFKK
jgi:tRNA (guanine-N7-)-methyltransferase